jgi:hypothetical protein
MNKITPLMTSLHEGHKAEERIKCIDNMLFKKCDDTKDTILQAFWWYRKHSIPLDKVKEAREEIEGYKKRQLALAIGVKDLEQGKQVALDYVITILDKLIESEV